MRTTYPDSLSMSTHSNVTGLVVTVKLPTGDTISTSGSVMQGGVYPQAMNDRGQFAFYAFIQRGSTNLNAVVRADPVPGLSPGNPIMPEAGTPLPRGWRFVVRCSQGLLCTGSGGLGSVPGAILGGLLLGFVDSFVATLFDSVIAAIVGFAMIIIVLIFKPTGFLGHE